MSTLKGIDVTEEAKAVGAIAVATGKVVDAGVELGRFVGKVLGTVPQNAVGILVGDWLHEVRIRNMSRLQQRTEEILGARGQAAQIEAVSPTLAIPLFKAAQDESDESLQELWARLLASAMDRSRSGIRRTFIETVQKFDAIDAAVFSKIIDGGGVTQPFIYDSLHISLTISKDSRDVSIDHLKKLEVISDASYQQYGGWGELHHLLALSPYGRELAKALSR